MTKKNAGSGSRESTKQIRVARIKEIASECKSVAEISRRTSIPLSTVYRLIDEENINSPITYIPRRITQIDTLLLEGKSGFEISRILKCDPLYNEIQSHQGVLNYRNRTGLKSIHEERKKLRAQIPQVKQEIINALNFPLNSILQTLVHPLQSTVDLTPQAIYQKAIKTDSENGNRVYQQSLHYISQHPKNNLSLESLVTIFTLHFKGGGFNMIAKKIGKHSPIVERVIKRSGLKANNRWGHPKGPRYKNPQTVRESVIKAHSLLSIKETGHFARVSSNYIYNIWRKENLNSPQISKKKYGLDFASQLYEATDLNFSLEEAIEIAGYNKDWMQTQNKAENFIKTRSTTQKRIIKILNTLFPHINHDYPYR